MKKIPSLLSALIITLSAIGMVSLATPTTVYANSQCTQRFLTFPAWYRGLLDGNCEVKPPSQSDTGLSNFIWRIVLNIIEMFMLLVGYVSVFFIIVGGFRYITAAGTPDQMTASKKTIMNAIIGLIIAIASVAIVNAIGAAI